MSIPDGLRCNAFDSFGLEKSRRVEGDFPCSLFPEEISFSLRLGVREEEVVNHLSGVCAFFSVHLFGFAYVPYVVTLSKLSSYRSGGPRSEVPPEPVSGASVWSSSPA